MKKLIILLAFGLTCLLSFAQVDPGGGGSEIITGIDTSTVITDTTVIENDTVVDNSQEGNWLAENYGKLFAILLALYEIVIRVYPTVGNYSLVSLLMKILSVVIPNRRAEEATAKASTKRELDDKHEVIT